MIPEESDIESSSRPYTVVAACAMVYYAAERTLLSVVFMALGMMALGFVIDRFGVILRIAPHMAGPPHHPTTYSLWAGSIVVLAGSFVAVIAAIRYSGLERRFQREGCGITGHGLTLGVLFSLFVALIGVVISMLLITVRF